MARQGGSDRGGAPAAAHKSARTVRLEAEAKAAEAPVPKLTTHDFEAMTKAEIADWSVNFAGEEARIDQHMIKDDMIAAARKLQRSAR